MPLLIWPILALGGIFLWGRASAESAEAAEQIADAAQKLVIVGAVGVGVVYTAKKIGVVK